MNAGMLHCCAQAAELKEAEDLKGEANLKEAAKLRTREAC